MNLFSSSILLTVLFLYSINARNIFEHVSRHKRQTSSETRLVHGPYNYIGMVQVRVNGEWTYLLDRSFREREADIVCSSLGYHGSGSIAIPNSGLAFQTTSEARIGRCNGQESSIVDCITTDPVEVAGVQCEYTDYEGLRLVGDRDEYTGRLEVNYGGVWGTVCDETFNRYNAEVACAELGYTGGEVLPSNSEGKGVIWYSRMRCQGNEQSLDNCYRPYSIGHGNAACSHSNDVSIRCDRIKPEEPQHPEIENPNNCEILLQDNDYFETTHPYSSNTNRCWIIGAGRGQKVRLSFTKFDIEEGHGACPFDKVIVYDGAARDNLIDTFCGTRRPGDIISSGRYLHIRFISDIVVNKEGFNANYFFIGSSDSGEEEPPRPQPSDCGVPAVTPNDPGDFIVGGREAVPHSHPWIILLESDQGFCGGSIISENFVVTASHCVDGLSSPDSIRITVGNHEHNEDEPNKKVYEASEIINHEDWGSFYLGNDISLLRTKESIEFNDHVSPICLPDYDERITGDVLVAGWGDLKGVGSIELPDSLQEVVVPTIDIEVCNQPDWLNGIIQADNQICAGYESGGQDSCLGDSGGPLTKRKNGRTILYGLVSYGYDDRCAIEKKPGIYTRVSEYVRWIYRNTRGEAGSP